jgi:hypothetical protein
MFSIWFALMIALGFVFGSEGKALSEEVKLSTLESAELYFKNVRSNSYYMRNGTPEEVDIYELKSFDIDSSTVSLTPLIVNNWRHNLAYIQLEPNFEADHYSLIFKSQTETDSLQEDFPQRVQQFELAIRIYNAIEADQEIFLSIEGKQYPLFSGGDRKKRFRIVLRDYFRLVNVI